MKSQYRGAYSAVLQGLKLPVWRGMKGIWCVKLGRQAMMKDNYVL